MSSALMHSFRCRCALRLGRSACVGATMMVLNASSAAPPVFQLVGTQAGPGGAFDLTSDGRIVSVVGDSIMVETDVGSGVYVVRGLISTGLISPFGASFFRVSPDGSRFAIGDGNFGGAHVYIGATSDLTGGVLNLEGLAQENYEAQWMSGSHLAVTYANPLTFFGEVAVLDIDGGTSTPVLSLGGASAGVAFDILGNLYTGNGFDFLPGGSDTGEIRGFEATRIAEVLSGSAPMIDFETEGVLIADLLTAGSLGFDDVGHFFVGGGDIFGGSGDFGYFAIASSEAVANAMAGLGAVQIGELYRDDPEGFGSSVYSARFNFVTGEWFVVGNDSSVVYRYVLVPGPGGLLLSLAAGLFVTPCRSRRGGRRHASQT